MDSVFIEFLSVQYLVRKYKTNSNNKAAGGRNRFSTFMEPNLVFYPNVIYVLDKTAFIIVCSGKSGKQKRVLQM